LKINWKRWLIVVYLAALMAFTASVLLIPGEKYDTLTTSDSGWWYGAAREYDNVNGVIENYSLSHAPDGFAFSTTNQAQPLLAVMLHRAVSAVHPGTSLMDVVKYWSPLLFALTLIPIFLIGKELAGDFAGCTAAFFASVMTGTIYWMKVGAFDEEALITILAAWTMYLTIRLFKAPRKHIPLFAVLAGLTYGLFGLEWDIGSYYLAPVIVGGLLLVMLVGFLGRWLRKSTGIFGALVSTLRDNLYLILGVFGMLAVFTLVVWGFGGTGPSRWIDFSRTLLSYVGIGGGGAGGVGGAPAERYATEMQAPTSWGDTINSFYIQDILTKVVFIFVALALVKICLSRKRWELLVFPWLIIILGLVWPGRGQARFERQWWPFVPVVAGVGAAFLVGLIGRLSRESMTSSWVEPLQKPVVIAMCLSLIAVPFIINARDTAVDTTPPPEWNRPSGTDQALIGACNWLRENTPEDSVVAVEWSFGHLFTGASERATVCDGCEASAQEGTWENDPSFTPRPPDFIYSAQTGYIYGGQYLGRRSYQINGRRVDVQALPDMGENEFRWIITAYRDTYNCKIDYIVFDYMSYYGASLEAKWAPARLLYNSTVLKQLQSSPQFDGTNYIFDFGENRTDVTLNLEDRSVSITTADGTKYLDGYAVFPVDESGNVTDFYGFVAPPSAPDIPETLLIFVDENGQITTGTRLVQSKSAEINALQTPMGVRVFTGDIGDIGYLQAVYMSPNQLVGIWKIYHVPSLTLPADGTRTNDNTPTFQWRNALGAVRYKLVVDNNADFTSPEITLDNISVTAGAITEYTPTDGLADGTYSWRVMAYRADNEELGWSSTQTFVIDTIPPSTPTLISPENNYIDNNLTQTFTWTQPEPNATYQLQISTENSFASPYHDNSSLTEISYSYTLPAGGTYYWRVRASDNVVNQSAWSENFKLTITAPSGAPSLSFPENGLFENDNTPTFGWAAGFYAENHRLLVDNDPDFSSPVENRLFTTEFSYTPAAENSLPDDNYSWKVVGINEWGETPSPVWIFTVDTIPPSAPALVSPTNGLHVDNTPDNFDWSDVADAERYEISVDNNADFSFPAISASDVSFSTYTPTITLENGTYYWKVRAYDNAGNVGPFSSTWTFVLGTVPGG